MKYKAEITSVQTIVHQYRYLYFLANELAYKAISDKHEINAFRYSIGTVIMSYTTIENYFNHIFYSEEYPLRELHNEMSEELTNKIERLSITEKIEFAIRFYPKVQPSYLDKSKEPYQSFDLLRQIRNILIHYIPQKETVLSKESKYTNNFNNIEKKLKGKFNFVSLDNIKSGEQINEFLFRLFNRECAKWSFECILPFIKALSKTFHISEPRIDALWDLNINL